MEKVSMSPEAYTEFKSFLEENKIEDYSIRISFAGNGCSGPSFNISVEEKEDGDIATLINDINFIVKNELIDEFGGFIILSSEENGGRGLSLKPLIQAESGCGTCGGCH
jgi:iron-sulfur cluster insertion protein